MTLAQEAMQKLAASIQREMRANARLYFRQALLGGRHAVVTYVVARHTRKARQDLLIYGTARFEMTDAKRLLIFHQCRRLFRIQDRLREQP